MLHLLWKKVRTLKHGYWLVFIFMLFCQAMFAQPRDLNQYDHDSKPYYFGITLGANMSRFQTELHSKFLQNDSVYVAEPVNSTGFALGLLATARISDRFQARFNPQLLFTERSILYKLKYPEGTEVTKTVESVIVTFPLQLKLQSDRIGNFRVYMLTGVKGDIDLASNARAKADDLVKIKKHDYGIELGMGFNFFFESFILSPEIKISNGLNNIHARDERLIYSNVFDKIQSRMIMFSIHIEG